MLYLRTVKWAGGKNEYVLCAYVSVEQLNKDMSYPPLHVIGSWIKWMIHNDTTNLKES